MEKEFVNYEIALELKNLGFNEACFVYIYTGDTGNNVDHIIETKPSLAKNHNVDSLCISKPTFSQAFAFFREKYGYDVTIKKCTPSEYKFEIEQLFAEGNNHYFIDFVFKSYKEAELKCLDKLIETVKRKK